MGTEKVTAKVAETAEKDYAKVRELIDTYYSSVPAAIDFDYLQKLCKKLLIPYTYNVNCTSCYIDMLITLAYACEKKFAEESERKYVVRKRLTQLIWKDKVIDLQALTDKECEDLLLEGFPAMVFIKIAGKINA